ncbi:DNA repair protein RecN [Selenomonas sp.]|uniref:DNA repair protein RecN n=1 Tax=Selenomonas sp. TaxID=2053611 RepID=UPI003FA1F176
MLRTLTVWNFALLEHVKIEFGAGLNILTGETGAGKSILIDALGAVLGSRLAAAAIRSGCEWLRVEAVFDLEGQAALKALLEEQAIPVEDDELIITRQVSHKGKNSVLLNGCRVTLTLLKELGAHLVDIHGQHDNLALLRPENQLVLLDSADAQIEKQRGVYQKSFAAWNDCKKRLKAKEEEAKSTTERLDLLHWQEKEIEEAALKDGEDERIEAEIRKLSNAEKISGFVEESYTLLNGELGGKALNVLAALSKVKKNLESLSRFGSELDNACKMVENAYCDLQEASYEIRDYGSDMEFDQHRLDALENRMSVIDKLCRKYGATATDVLAHLAKVKDELQRIENYDADVEDLKVALRQSEIALKDEAKKLTKLRAAAAKELSSRIGEQVRELGMAKARFSIALRAADYGATGADDIVMLFSANAGEKEQPLQDVASGGELSRVALAVKAVSAANDDSPPSMVFDEIDTGIGGKTARMVAERIATVALHRQVLCITHLPQIACMADAHLYIHKETQGERTLTEVHLLTEGERINEIARMASGSDITAAALDNAREMVDNARIKRAKISRR